MYIADQSSTRKRCHINLYDDVLNVTTNVTAISLHDNVVTTVPKRRKQTTKNCNMNHDRPKRAPSAYNIFFHLKRERILNDIDHNNINNSSNNVVNNIQSNHQRYYSKDLIKQAAMYIRNKPKRKHVKVHGFTIPFQEMTLRIANEWKQLDESQRTLFQQQATKEMDNYKIQLNEWKNNGINMKLQNETITNLTSVVVSDDELSTITTKDSISLKKTFNDYNTKIFIRTFTSICKNILS